MKCLFSSSLCVKQLNLFVISSTKEQPQEMKFSSNICHWQWTEEKNVFFALWTLSSWLHSQIHVFVSFFPLRTFHWKCLCFATFLARGAVTQNGSIFNGPRTRTRLAQVGADSAKSWAAFEIFHSAFSACFPLRNETEFRLAGAIFSPHFFPSFCGVSSAE